MDTTNTQNEILDYEHIHDVVAESFGVYENLVGRGFSPPALIMPVRMIDGRTVNYTPAYSPDWSYEGVLDPQWFESGCVSTYVGFPELYRQFYSQYHALARTIPGNYWIDVVSQPTASGEYDIDQWPWPTYPVWEDHIITWTRKIEGGMPAPPIWPAPDPWEGFWASGGYYYDTLEQLAIAMSVLSWDIWNSPSPDGIAKSYQRRSMSFQRMEAWETFPEYYTGQATRRDQDIFHVEITYNNTGEAWIDVPLTVTAKLSSTYLASEAQFPPIYTSDGQRATFGIAPQGAGKYLTITGSIMGGVFSDSFEASGNIRGSYADAVTVMGSEYELPFSTGVTIPSYMSGRAEVFVSGVATCMAYVNSLSPPASVNNIIGRTTLTVEVSFGPYSMSYDYPVY